MKSKKAVLQEDINCIIVKEFYKTFGIFYFSVLESSVKDYNFHNNIM